MRPAHCAREVDGRLERPGRQIVASMRPAHCAREVEEAAKNSKCFTSFNEARALCAGSLRGIGNASSS